MKATSAKALRAWFAYVLTWLVHWGLWLAYTANVGFRELIAGATALVSTIAMWVFLCQSKVKFKLRWRDIIQGWRLPWYAIDGTLEVMHGLAKQLFTRNGAPSFTGTVPFDVGGDDPESAGRRALAISYTTITPNFVVLGIIPEQRLLLYHQIVPGEVLRWRAV
jgi:multisubunit Na+/H+ antiporter MnhE subunit